MLCLKWRGNVDKRKQSSGICRRSFIKTLGMVTGAAAVYPLEAHARLLFNGGNAPRIGVLVPRSTVSPLMGENLVAGMKLHLAACGWEKTQLIVEEAGTETVIARGRSLLTVDKVDILAGILNPLSIPHLYQALDESGAIFINIEGGANSFLPRRENPSVYHNSFGYWQANWAAGAWAAARLGKRAFAAGSFYETGYDSYYAFPQGFAAAGGEIVRSDVTHLAPDKTGLSQLMKAIREASPDFVHAVYSGRDAVDFVKAYAAAGLAGRIPLVASGFMVDESLLPAMGEAALGIKSCMSWAPGLESRENANFVAEYSRFAGRDADAFALLGFDTAALITTAVRNSETNAGNSDNLRRGLNAIGFASPRGRVVIDPETGSTDAPLYLREVSSEGGKLRNAVLAELPRFAVTEKKADLAAIRALSGWTNPYLCA
jgi:branched-chain amino acid transport system substrate-binding protein